MQAQFMSMLCVSQGTSVVTETIFENRFMHVNELMRLGANIRVDQRQAIIEGVPKLNAAEVKITDLRAGAALIIAGLIADGETSVYGLNHLRRGYHDLPQKLQILALKFVPNDPFFFRSLLNTLSGVVSIVVYVTLVIELIFMLSMVTVHSFNDIHYYIFLLIFLDSMVRLIIQPSRSFGYARLMFGFVLLFPY